MINMNFRYATENDLTLILDFIRQLAVYEKMLDEAHLLRGAGGFHRCACVPDAGGGIVLVNKRRRYHR